MRRTLRASTFSSRNTNKNPATFHTLLPMDTAQRNLRKPDEFPYWLPLAGPECPSSSCNQEVSPDFAAILAKELKFVAM